MPLDWTNFKPSNIPKADNNKTNDSTSVPPDTNVSGDPTEITVGPKKVFKKGYPTVQTVDTAGGGIYGKQTAKELGVKMQTRPLVASRDVQLLGVHGVADAAQVQEILHPKDQSVIDSIVREEAFVVTKECKVVDIASSEWPINLEVAPDVRAVLKRPVKYGEEIGVVEGSAGDCVFFKSSSASEASPVPTQDLEPVMLEKNAESPNKGE